MAKKVQYYNLTAEKKAQAELEALRNRPTARHFDFFMDRKRDAIPDKADVPRETLSVAQVIRATETGLASKSLSYFKQLSTWRKDLQFKKFDQVKVLDDVPHLGYAGITQGLVPDPDGTETGWAFYFANFNARFGKGDSLFENIPTQYGVTFYCLSLLVGPDGQTLGRDLRKRGNGLLFSTQNLTEAFETVAKLRQVQIAWQAVQRQRKEEGRSALILGDAAEPETKEEIKLVYKNIPSPEDLRKLLFTA